MREPTVLVGTLRLLAVLYLLFYWLPVAMRRVIYRVFRRLPPLMKVDRMKGPEFEQYCAKVLRLNGFHHVTVVGHSGDFGVDVLAWKWLRKYAIQCKRYSGHVGFEAVKEANAGVEFYRAHKAVVMTNSYFTANAVKGAKKCHVELWDRDRLVQMAYGKRRKSDDKKGMLRSRRAVRVWAKGAGPRKP